MCHMENTKFGLIHKEKVYIDAEKSPKVNVEANKFSGSFNFKK